MNAQLKNILHLNLALIIIGTAGPLGNYINLPPELSIFSRSLLAAFSIFIFIKFKKINLKFNFKKDAGSFFLCAFLQGLHWIGYFYALKLAGAGLGVISLFTFPIFTTLLEPVIRKTAFNPKHLLLALLVLVGLYILTPELNFGNQTTLGITFGILSALFYAIRNILMKNHVANYNATMLMFYQNGIVALLLIPILFFIPWNTDIWISQMPYLFFLGIITTAIGHTYLVSTFKHFSATSVSLLSCIQPVYVVIMAFFFLNEIPTFSTIIGGGIIISAVVLETFITKKIKVS